MNEQNRAQSAPGGSEFSTISPAVSDQQESRRKRCAQCGKPFGLIRRRRAGKQFCSARCAEQHADSVRKAVEARVRWYEFLYQRR